MSSPIWDVPTHLPMPCAQLSGRTSTSAPWAAAHLGCLSAKLGAVAGKVALFESVGRFPRLLGCCERFDDATVIAECRWVGPPACSPADKVRTVGVVFGNPPGRGMPTC